MSAAISSARRTPARIRSAFASSAPTVAFIWSRATRNTLISAPPGRDLAGVEAEPVHAPEIAGVLHLQAPVHDHGQAASTRDLGPFRADHSELQPERPRA